MVGEGLGTIVVQHRGGSNWATGRRARTALSDLFTAGLKLRGRATPRLRIYNESSLERSVR
jgi:hypothetical protein